MGWSGGRIRAFCASIHGRAGSGLGLFVLRLAVQLPLYLAGDLVALGVAKTAMGFPIFAIAVWLSYLVLRKDVDLRPYPERG